MGSPALRADWTSCTESRGNMETKTFGSSTGSAAHRHLLRQVRLVLVQPIQVDLEGRELPMAKKRPKHARGDMVKPNDVNFTPLMLKAVQDFLDLCQHFGFYRFIHQALGRAPNQLKSFFQNIQSQAHGHHGVQP